MGRGVIGQFCFDMYIEKNNFFFLLIFADFDCYNLHRQLASLIAMPRLTFMQD